MAKSIYLTSSESACGKSVVCLGILEMILRKTSKVAIYKPIISDRSDGLKDSSISLLHDHFGLTQDYEEAFGFYRREAHAFIHSGKWESVLDKIIQDYKRLEQQYDFILVIGTDYKKDGSTFESNINLEITRNLSIPVLIVGRADRGDQVDEIVEPTVDMVEQFDSKECEVIGVIINKAPLAISHEIMVHLRGLVGHEPVISVIAESDVIRSPTVEEIKDQLGGTVLYGEDLLTKQVFRYSVAAMAPKNYLERIKDHCLVITPGDREDIIVTVLQAHLSKNYPSVSGLLLTTTHRPKDSVLRLIDGLSEVIPIIAVSTNTYETANKLSKVKSVIRPKNLYKIEAALQTFEKYVDVNLLEKKISGLTRQGITPRMFQYLLTERAKKNKMRIVMPEGTDERVLRATDSLLSKGITSIILLGQVEQIQKKALDLGLTLSYKDLTIINPEDSDNYNIYVQEYLKLRKHKGINLDVAKDLMLDPSYFGTMMVFLGDADGMVSGSVNTTAHTIRPALQFVKTKLNVSVVSSVFFMCLEDRVLVYGDCAINPNPNADQLAEIAKASAKTALSFGIEPLVALLSYSSGSSGSGEDVEKVRKAVTILKKEKAAFLFDGPIQYDAAVDMKVANQKLPDSPVAGKANVLIFPDLNTGNNTYKAVQRETNAVAIGPILQGLNKPVNDLSRGCTVTDIINTVIITAIQAQEV